MAHRPIRVMTRCLAEMQTNILASGLRTFDGDLDRFVIYTLIVRQSYGANPGGAPSPISAYSLAASLSRSFETVRRHVLALIARGFCERVERGVLATPHGLALPEIRNLAALAHDSFVRFVEDMTQVGVPVPSGRTDVAYSMVVGLQAAADVMLATTETNRNVHDDWLSLAIFSTIFAANMREVSDDPALSRRFATSLEPVPVSQWHPVRSIAVARALGLPPSTVHRQIGRASCRERV